MLLYFTVTFLCSFTMRAFSATQNDVKQLTVKVKAFDD